MLALTLGAALLVGDSDFVRKTWNDTLSAFFYMYHVVHPVHEEVVRHGAPEIRPFLHLWSLSVEEHFYLVAALLIAVSIKKRLMVHVAVVFAGLWIAVSTARLLGHVGPNMMWYQRPDSLLLGVVAAVVNASSPTTWSKVAHRRLARFGTAVALGTAVVLFIGTKFAKPFGVFVEFIPDVADEKTLRNGTYWGEFGFSIVALCAAAVTVVTVPTHAHGDDRDHRGAQRHDREAELAPVGPVPQRLPVGHVGDELDEQPEGLGELGADEHGEPGDDHGDRRQARRQSLGGLGPHRGRRGVHDGGHHAEEQAVGALVPGQARPDVTRDAGDADRHPQERTRRRDAPRAAA